MASITKRPGPKGTTWRVVYREPDGRQRARHFPTKAEAERFRAEVTTDLHRGVYRDPDAGNVSFEAVFNAWLDGRRVDLAPSTWALYESVGITHVAGEFAEQRIGDIRAAHVRTWIAALAKEGRGRSLIGTARLVMHEVCAQAVADGLIPSNPVAGSSCPAPSTCRTAACWCPRRSKRSPTPSTRVTESSC